MGVRSETLHSTHSQADIMQALYLLPALVAATSAAPQLLVGGHAPLVHAAAPAVVARPVVHAAPALVHRPVAVAAAGYAADPLAEVSPYNLNYAVADDYSGSSFTAAESSDGLGVKTGSYQVALPDGRTQTVNYSTDDVNGYVADVSYDGVPQYPVAKAAVVARPAVAVAHAPLATIAHPAAHV